MERSRWAKKLQRLGRQKECRLVTGTLGAEFFFFFFFLFQPILYLGTGKVRNWMPCPLSVLEDRGVSISPVQQHPKMGDLVVLERILAGTVTWGCIAKGSVKGIFGLFFCILADSRFLLPLAPPCLLLSVLLSSVSQTPCLSILPRISQTDYFQNPRFFLYSFFFFSYFDSKLFGLGKRGWSRRKGRGVGFGPWDERWMGVLLCLFLSCCLLFISLWGFYPWSKNIF